MNAFLKNLAHTYALRQEEQEVRACKTYYSMEEFEQLLVTDASLIQLAKQFPLTCSIDFRVEKDGYVTVRQLRFFQGHHDQPGTMLYSSIDSMDLWLARQQLLKDSGQKLLYEELGWEPLYLSIKNLAFPEELYFHYRSQETKRFPFTYCHIVHTEEENVPLVTYENKGRTQSFCLYYSVKPVTGKFLITGSDDVFDTWSEAFEVLTEKIKKYRLRAIFK